MARVRAESFMPGDKIVVNIAAIENSPRGVSRLPIGATFDFRGRRLAPDGVTVMEGAPGLQLDGPVGAAPQFPAEEYNAAIRAQDRDRADEIIADYHDALDEYREGNGGGDLGDLLGAAVLRWAKDALGVSTDPNVTGPVINPDHISVRPSYRIDDGPTTFVVQMNPVWGQR